MTLTRCRNFSARAPLRLQGGITAARAIRDQLLAQRGRVEPVEGRTQLRFGDAADQWLAGPVLDLRPRTEECYRHAVEAHLNPRFKSVRLDAISPDDLAELVREMRSRGLSESASSIVIGVANRIYRFAARRLGRNGVNPVSLMFSSEGPKPAQTKRRRIFEGRETGARVSELLGPHMG